jgi:hypothetical protein
MQCVINGHFAKTKRGKVKDGFDFAANFQEGALSLRLEFVMDKQFVNY